MMVNTVVVKFYRLYCAYRVGAHIPEAAAVTAVQRVRIRYPVGHNGAWE
jgi:hypothetical protein